MFQVLTALKISEENNSHKTISNAGKMKEVTLAIKLYRNKKKSKKQISSGKFHLKTRPLVLKLMSCSVWMCSF
jgi:PBP1b-binding outer membrane lipoprotein LpoB